MSEDQRIICSGCRAVLFDGPPSEVPDGLLALSPADKTHCPQCGSQSRQIEKVIGNTATVTSGVGIGVAGQTRHSSKHRFSREALVQTRVGRDGRKVERVMENVRDHDPPFKWHRVVDAETGEVIKNQLIDHSTERAYDFRDPEVAVPEWFPFGDPRQSA